ncbi:uncharacterized protein LOC123259300 [Cotesia glomerata]|uniref:uncharacterized protein LOC123259300 n=1 Tax=Cotesia glomerata TaxID=32391 RepID=UPI001D0190DA|nr:uncharacterized protein LOC123259300 [Cotesia glomerata]
MMYLCSSSMSQCPQTKVTWLVKNISLVLILVLLGLLRTHPVVSSPVQVQHNTHQLRYCRFETTHKFYTVNDLFKCINELVPRTKHRKSRSADDKAQLFMSYKNKDIDESQFVPHAEARTFYTDFVDIKRGPLPRNDGNYYQYPGQIYPTDPNPRPGILGINLLEAFSSINKYDDRKCVHRIICEAASGVTPGNVGFKRANSIFGIGSLIDYLTTRTFDISSPLLTFGKSALMGWNNRGNPDVCYQRYPQCPRSQNELISYLNNYNGGFFRFFNYHNTGSYNRGLDAVDSQMVSDRKATGELKFDTPSSRTVLVERSKKNDDHNRVVFPDQQYVKILDYTDSDKFNNSPESSFFPQDRKDQKVEELVYDFHSDKSSQSEDKDKDPSAVPKESQQASRGSHKNHGKLYLPTKNTPYSTKKLSSYTFPDGQRIMIDTTFSKLFSNSYKKPLKRGLVNNAPRAIDMEGLYVINLTELYPTVNDDTRPVEEQVIHPCDVICHDSRGTAVQFTQFVNSNDDNSNINSNYASADKNKFLTTLMTPEHPILDLSKRLPCQIICLNARGQRRRITTTFNKIIRSKLTNNQEGGYQSGKTKIIKPRFVGEPIIYDKHPIIQLSDSPGVPLSTLPWAGGSGIVNPSWGQRSPTMPSPSDDPDTPTKVIGSPLSFEKGDTVIGDNPLAITTNISSPNHLASSGGYPLDYFPNLKQQSPPATTITICNGRIYIMPANTVSMPLCATIIDSESISNSLPLLKKEKNSWGNYTHFFQELANLSRDDKYNFDNNPDNTELNDSVESVGFLNEHIPPQDFGLVEVDTTTAHYLPSFTDPPPVSETSQEPNYEEYSCLENESWDAKSKQCTPTTLDSVDTEETEDENSDEFHKLPIGQRSTRRQRIVIKTPHANMYIQSN